MTVAAVNASNVLKVYSEICRLCAVSSSTPMVSAVEEFLKMVRNSEVIGGTMMR
jgi:hypothetical protein